MTCETVAHRCLRFGLVCLLMIGPARSVHAEMATLIADQDTYGWDADPDTNFGSNQSIWTMGSSSQNAHSMVGFDMSPITSSLNPGDAIQINSATFRAYKSSFNIINMSLGTIHIHEGTDDTWDEDTATWNTHGLSFDPTILGTTVVGLHEFGWFEWDASGITVEDFLDDDYLSIYQTMAEEFAFAWTFVSTEDFNAEWRAQLVLDYDVVSNAVPGDADGDGDVDLDDFDILTVNMYTSSGGGASVGDFNNDGDVNFDDFVIQALNFGTGGPDEAVGALPGVPEPASLVWVLSLWAVALHGRRRVQAAS